MRAVTEQRECKTSPIATDYERVKRKMRSQIPRCNDPSIHDPGKELCLSTERLLTYKESNPETSTMKSHANEAADRTPPLNMSTQGKAQPVILENIHHRPRARKETPARAFTCSMD